ncbi:hypothetical protein NPIL_242521 [Nephila pilipes]|uniref:Uncharacterized protein n=1 Tax=Nephila pilipes TaxID=299642 RepID=A0A8X6TJT1_NEPPI|nr:hypothetical protein NPIL_242521 [Nephila pilipes]
MEMEKIFLLAWIWCAVRFAFFNSYEIVFLPSFIILLDLILTSSKELTSNEDDPGSSRKSIPAQKDQRNIKIRNNLVPGKEEKELNDMIWKLMNEEKKKTWYKVAGKEEKELNDMILNVMYEERKTAWHKIRKTL